MSMKYESYGGTFEVKQFEAGSKYQRTQISCTGDYWERAHIKDINDGVEINVKGHWEWDCFVRFMAKIAAQQGYCILNTEKLQGQELIERVHEMTAEMQAFFDEESA
jgi:hypothetical protein